MTVWELQSKEAKVIKTLTGLGHSVQDVAFSPVGQYLAAVDLTGSMMIWSTKVSWPAPRFCFSYAESPMLNTFEFLTGVGDGLPVSPYFFSP